MGLPQFAKMPCVRYGMRTTRQEGDGLGQLQRACTQALQLPKCGLASTPSMYAAQGTVQAKAAAGLRARLDVLLE